MDFIIVYKSFFYLYISLSKKQCAQSTKNLSGVEVPENYDQGAGSIDVLWTIKPGSEALPPNIRLGFVCLI